MSPAHSVRGTAQATQEFWWRVADYFRLLGLLLDDDQRLRVTAWVANVGPGFQRTKGIQMIKDARGVRTFARLAIVVALLTDLPTNGIRTVLLDLVVDVAEDQRRHDVRGLPVVAGQSASRPSG